MPVAWTLQSTVWSLKKGLRQNADKAKAQLTVSSLGVLKESLVNNLHGET